MKPLRMRTIRHRSRSLLIVALALVDEHRTRAARRKGGKGRSQDGCRRRLGAEQRRRARRRDRDGSTTAAAPARRGSARRRRGPAATPARSRWTTTRTSRGDLAADLARERSSATRRLKTGPVKKTPLSWKDIVVVIRKPFLKVRRTELNPFVGTTMNDNMIRHYTIGGELAYCLTDVLAVGVEGQYYSHTFEEPYDLVARQARRLPTVNQYNWSARARLPLRAGLRQVRRPRHKLITWESYFTAGIGVGQSEVVPRDTRVPRLHQPPDRAEHRRRTCASSSRSG